MAIPAIWICRWTARGGRVSRTFADPAIGLILAATAVSLIVSPDLALSFPKLCGIILGVALFYALANAGAPAGLVRALLAGLSLIAAALAGVGTLITAWPAEKVPGLTDLGVTLPSFARLFGSYVMGGAAVGIHPNELAGALSLLVPVPAAVLLAGRAVPGRLRAGGSVGLVAALAALLLTQSRSAWIGTAVGAIFLVVTLRRSWGERRPPRWLRHRRWDYLGLAAGGITVTAGWVASGLADQTWGATVAGILARVVASGPSRIEVWSRALAMIRDFPVTGVGLNTFPIVLSRYYPLIQSATSDVVPHAHNIYLQTGVDLGLLGLVAYIGLIGTGVLVGTMRDGESDAVRILARASAAGILSFSVFGLGDAITLGARPGILLWLLLGSIALVERSDRRARCAPSARIGAAHQRERMNGIGTEREPRFDDTSPSSVKNT